MSYNSNGKECALKVTIVSVGKKKHCSYVHTGKLIAVIFRYCCFTDVAILFSKKHGEH